jgi:23S rRNA (adenine2503-C2)-methyltransferase
MNPFIFLFCIMKENLFGKTISELKSLAGHLNLPSYTANQIADWLYKKNISSVEQMTNLPKSARKILDNSYCIEFNKLIKEEVSRDGTIKYLYSVGGEKYIETVCIPEQKRNTLCVSTQVGCKMGCIFCLTGRQGFQQNLSPDQILSQVRDQILRSSVSNIVFMGMGEPLDNLGSLLISLEILTADYGYAMSPSRITVSTIGIIPALRQLIEKSRCNIAISLNSPFEDERKYLVPPEKKYPAKKIIEVLKEYNLSRQRRLSFEYILFRGYNDTEAHVNKLASVLNGLRCRINLIRFHSFEGSRLEASDEQSVRKFKDGLNRKGILTTIRASRGQDISAACGMLYTRNLRIAGVHVKK